MPLEQLRLLLVIAGITLVSGIGDAQGFIHAARMWKDGTIVWEEFAKSATGFGIGISTYWLAVRYLNEFGILSPETQTLIWFGLTLIGVALISGKFFVWPRIDQAVATFVFLGIGWLMLRVVA